MNDGSITAQEYLQLAAGIEAERRREEAERVAAFHTRRVPSTLLAQFNAAIAQGPTHVTCHADGTQTVAAVPSKVSGLDPDLVITNVHNLPGRVRLVQRSFGSIIQYVSPGMLEQQDTGRYPTVEEHLARRSPGYLIDEDKMGRTTYQKLSTEEENACRNT